MGFQCGVYFHPRHECFAGWGEGTLEWGTDPQNSEKLSGILGQPQMAGLLSFALCITQLF